MLVGVGVVWFMGLGGEGVEMGVLSMLCGV